MFGSEDTGRAGIAGLGGDAPTIVSGMPTTIQTSTAEDSRVYPEWPLVLLLAAVSALGAWVLVGAEWGDKTGPAAVARGAVGGVVGLPALPDTAKPAAGASLLRPERFRTALAEVVSRAGTGARASLLRVDPGQVWAITLRPDGSQRVIRVPVAGEPTVQEGGAGAFDGIAFARIDVRAPSRVVAALRRDHGVLSSRVDYLVVTGFGGDVIWNAFLVAAPGKLPRQFTADARGRSVRQVG